MLTPGGDSFQNHVSLRYRVMGEALEHSMAKRNSTIPHDWPMRIAQPTPVQEVDARIQSPWERIAEIEAELPAGTTSRYDPAGALRVIDALLLEDVDEQRRDWDAMREALDEDRPEGSKLFP